MTLGWLNSQLGAVHSPGWESEIYIEEAVSREISWAEGRPKDVQTGRSRGASVRVVRRGRQGFAYGTGLSGSALGDLGRRARTAALSTPPDHCRGLPRPAGDSGRREIEPLDKTLLKKPVSELQSLLSRQENQLRRDDRRI